MKGLVVYDTKSGMTEKIAEAIASGMQDAGLEATVKNAEEAQMEDFLASDVWVVGSPTHVGGPTGTAKKVLKVGINAGCSGKKGATFDTRFANIKKGAADKLAERMAEAGIQLVLDPQCFVVTGMKGPLAPGEEQSAKEFGNKIAVASR